MAYKTKPLWLLEEDEELDERLLSPLPKKDCKGRHRDQCTRTNRG